MFKIQYWMYAATGGPNVKWGSQSRFQMVGPGTTSPAGDGPVYMQLKEEFLICESLEMTTEVTDDQENSNNFFQQNKLVESRLLSMHRRRPFYPQ